MPRFVVAALAILLVVAPHGSTVAGASAWSIPDGHSADQSDDRERPPRSANAPEIRPENGSNHPTVRINAVYPNPVAAGDRGEFVVLAVPPGTNLTGYRLADEQGQVPLPNETAGGRVAVAWDPRLVRNLTDARVVTVDGSLTLANGGERLTLSRDGETVATRRYREAPEGEIGHFGRDGTIVWQPLGRTDRPVVTANGGNVRAFVLPDSPGVPVEVLRNAEERILLAGYTVTSKRVAQALIEASARGVEVRVLLEGAPVDGVSRRQARLLDSLVEHGVEVRMLGGERGRYAFHHAKYAVVDDRAVVLTENWKPAGTGGRASRGWGVVVSQSPVVWGLAETFHADANWTGARPWRQFRQGRSFDRGSTANGTYDGQFEAERVPVERTELLVTPDNGGDRVTAVIANASETVDVVQLGIDGPDQRFLRATLEAARRGVDVRILLSSAWYVRDENLRLVEDLRARADAEDLPLAARLAEPAGRYEKIHAKGVIVDGDRVVLGSLNWNDESVRENREVLLLLEGDEVGAYYQRVFDGDWEGGDGPGSPFGSLPLGSLAAVGGAVVLAVLVLRRVEFGENVGVGP